MDSNVEVHSIEDEEICLCACHFQDHKGHNCPCLCHSIFHYHHSLNDYYRANGINNNPRPHHHSGMTGQFTAQPNQPVPPRNPQVYRMAQGSGGGLESLTTGIATVVTGITAIAGFFLLGLAMILLLPIILKKA